MWHWLSHPDYATFWTAVGAISTGIAAILGAIALIYTISGFRKSLRESHYSSLDGMYLDILQITLERPYLKAPGLLADGQRGEYDTYAYILWNFLESIHDRCQADRRLRSTWYPTIQAESLIHAGWLQDAGNRIKFKKAFLDFVAAGDFASR